MGKYLCVAGGLLAMTLGVWGMRAAWPLVWTAIKVLVPVLFVLGGFLAVMVGVGEIRDRLADNKARTDPTTRPTP